MWASRQNLEGEEARMGFVYRNLRTGKLAELPEASEFTNKKQQLNARRVLEKMDTSKRWERLDDPREIEAARRAWDESRRAKTTTSRAPAPTPVYVVNAAPAPEPAPVVDVSDPGPGRSDGVHHAGGPWYEVVVDGETVDKVRGKEPADLRYEELA